MKFKVTLATFFLSIFLVYSQKKEIYVNDDLKEITIKKFNKKEHYHTYQMHIELDSLIIHAKVINNKKGKISKSLLDTIRSQLTSLSNKKIPKNHIIVINYYHGKDRCNSGGDFSFARKKMNGYRRRISREKNVSQFFMYKSDEGIEKYGKKLEWIPDTFDTIRKLFLPLPYPCGSFVLIDSYGNFYASRGEYNSDIITKLLRDTENTFSGKL
jgi:hypothetical protein